MLLIALDHKVVPKHTCAETPRFFQNRQPFRGGDGRCFLVLRSKVPWALGTYAASEAFSVLRRLSLGPQIIGKLARIFCALRALPHLPLLLSWPQILNKCFKIQQFRTNETETHLNLHGPGGKMLPVQNLVGPNGRNTYCCYF